MPLPNSVVALLAVPMLGLGPRAQETESNAIVPKDLPKLAWIAGDWELKDGETTTVEHWETLAGTTMLGLSHAYDAKRTRSFEFLRIAEHEGRIAYLAQPGGGKVVPFFATKLVDGEVEFENPSHDYPQRIRYERTEGGITATISLLDGSKPTAYAYRRRES